MNGWVGEWMCGRVHGRKVGWVGDWVHDWMNACVRRLLVVDLHSARSYFKSVI